MDWKEIIGFNYTNSKGDMISVVLDREGGIQKDEAYEAFHDFLRACGYHAEEEEE